MRLAVPNETHHGETRVALTPENVASLVQDQLGLTVTVEPGAGSAAGFPDDAYAKAGAGTAPAAGADVLVRVGPLASAEELPEGSAVVGLLDPLGTPETMQRLAERRVSAFPLELLPRTTRAQTMDALSSMSTVAGYRAVLMAATESPRMFPMLMTAAGTLQAARVVVLGAGVAGLTAIATARRLGAAVEGFDIRAAAAEQVRSLGAKFIDLGTEDAEDAGGYARAQTDDEQARLRERLAEKLIAADAVISTALIPGRPAPLLIDQPTAERCKPGAVIVDLAAASGGNCAATLPDQRVDTGGAVVLGPTNLPTGAARDASVMLGRNITAFLALALSGGTLNLDDEIVRRTRATGDGDVLHPRLRERLGLPPVAPPAEDTP